MRVAAVSILLLGVAPVAAAAEPPPETGSARRRADAIDAALAHDAAAVEAADFMRAYARDLRAGDRVALADRYHRGGAWRVGQGAREFESWAAIRDSYAARWRPPAQFDWTELSYEPIGPDAVIVVGTFRWGPGEGRAALACSYTGLLLREDGALRLRLEDESCAPPG